jgi:hypothetical protein
MIGTFNKGSRVRTHCVRVYLSDRELAELDKLVQREQSDMSNVIRASILLIAQMADDADKATAVRATAARA